jgi:hypothetical protein
MGPMFLIATVPGLSPDREAGFSGPMPCPARGAPPGRKICSEADRQRRLFRQAQPPPKGPPWRVDSGPSLLESYAVFSSQAPGALAQKCFLTQIMKATKATG